MPSLAVPDFAPVVPEIFVACAAMALLMLGVFRRGDATRLVTWLAVAAVAVALGLVLANGVERRVSLYGMFVTDGFAMFMKTLVLIGSGLSLIMAIRYNERENMARFEFPVLILLATAGMLMMVSAADLISLYVGLELQSLALYVVASFKRDSVRSTEAGLKYFVLGALASGMLLYGASLVYGFAGSTTFATIAHTVGASGTAPAGLLFGIVFLAVGLAFKVSAVPFHVWTPDVYEGAPTPVTAFFSAAPKVAAMALFVRVMVEPFGPLVGEWRQIIWFVSVCSMVLGAFAAINQRNFKRLMAYSAIGHAGFALVGLAAGTPEGVQGVLVYMAIYIFMTLGTFGVILCMRRNGKMVEDIDDLAGLARTQPVLALALGIFMFSLAGIPPLAGFFAKVYVFLAAIQAGLVVLAVIGVLSSVVGAYYYVRIVKIMYFDEPKGAFDRPIGAEMAGVLFVTAVITLFFFVFPGPVIGGADAAAAALFGSG